MPSDFSLECEARAYQAHGVEDDAVTFRHRHLHRLAHVDPRHTLRVSLQSLEGPAGLAELAAVVFEI